MKEGRGFGGQRWLSSIAGQRPTEKLSCSDIWARRLMNKVVEDSGDQLVLLAGGGLRKVVEEGRAEIQERSVFCALPIPTPKLALLTFYPAQKPV